MIQAIETEYNGYKFRSRLEARWAVFFDAAGIKYEYEPEGFENENGERYLPDFYFPDYDWYGEVKAPRENAADEIVKASKFVGDKIKVLLLFGNLPQESDWEYWHYTAIQHNYVSQEIEAVRCLIGWELEKGHSNAHFIGWLYVCQAKPCSLYLLSRDSCDSYHVVGREKKIDLKAEAERRARLVGELLNPINDREMFMRLAPNLRLGYANVESYGSYSEDAYSCIGDDRIHAAYDKARKARFEYGETPKSGNTGTEDEA